MDPVFSGEIPTTPRGVPSPVAGHLVGLQGAWQTRLRADFAELSARKWCAPHLQAGEARVELNGMCRATARARPGEDRAHNTANFLLVTVLPKTNATSDVRLLAAVTQGREDDEASAVAGMVCMQELLRLRERTHWDVRGGGLAHSLSRSLGRAHDRILEMSSSGAPFDPHWSFDRTLEPHDTFRGISTSVTVAAIAGRVATFAHIGNTVALLSRDQEIQRVTSDHSVSALPGFSAMAEADRDRFGSLSRRVVGRERSLEVETQTRHLRPDDTLLLATGPLARSIEANEMEAVTLLNEADLGLAAQRLSFLASDDNDLGLVALRST